MSIRSPGKDGFSCQIGSISFPAPLVAAEADIRTRLGGRIGKKKAS